MARSRTAFSAQDHGFRFPNLFRFSFRAHWPLVGAIDLGSITYGLCGGMCFASLDFFYAGRAVPSQADIEQTSPRLRRHLVRRQLHSMSGLVMPKVIRWMLRSDTGIVRLVANRELPELAKRLDGGAPAVLALIRSRGVQDPTQNHQVVALGYDFDEATAQLTITLYDPNHPGQEPTLSMNLARPRHGISLNQSTAEPLRGFFLIPYRRHWVPGTW